MTYAPTPLSKILAPAASPAEPDKAAPVAPAAPAPATVPEKYAGKSLEDVIVMHQNAESAYGRSQTEVGSLRGLVSDLSAVTRTAPEAEPVVEPVTLSGDDLLNDPASAIRSVLQPELDAIRGTQEANNADALVQSESQALMQAHGNVDEIVSSESFLAFVARTADRQGDFQVAAHGEGLDQVRAARRLLDNYADFNVVATPTPTPASNDTTVTPIAAAAAVGNEGANTGAPVSTKPQMFEADVIELIRTDVSKYRSPTFQTEMHEAIREGRFVKQS